MPDESTVIVGPYPIPAPVLPPRYVDATSWVRALFSLDTVTALEPPGNDLWNVPFVVGKFVFSASPATYTLPDGSSANAICPPSPKPEPLPPR
ncbi:MAG: hypothetical protein ACREBI_04265 [Nitrosotalea sp.]